MKNAKKHLAIALALLSLTNTFAPAPFLDISPKVNAGLFSKTDFIVKPPAEYPEFQKALDRIYNDIDALETKINNEKTTLEQTQQAQQARQAQANATRQDAINNIQQTLLNGNSSWSTTDQLNTLLRDMTRSNNDNTTSQEIHSLENMIQRLETFKNYLMILRNKQIPKPLPIPFVDYVDSIDIVSHFFDDLEKKINEQTIEKQISGYSAHLANVYAKCVAQENEVAYIVKNQSLINLLKDSQFATYCDNYFPEFHYEKKQTTIFNMPIGGTPQTGPANEFLLSYIEDHCDPFVQKEDEARTSLLAKIALPISLIFAGNMLVNGLNKTVTFFKSIYNGISSVADAAYKRFIYNRKQIGDDPVALRNLLHEFLNETVVKQEDAVEKIINTITGMTNLWAQHDKNGTECTCACTMTFIGDSGVGKTWAARMLSKAIFNQDMQPWQFVTSTSITNTNASVNGTKLSPADQIFNQNSELIRQLTRNPRVVIVFDEIDKMHKWDPEDSVLERLRDARDTGKLLVKDGINQHYIDVSRTVFICISNELRECWGLPKNEKLSPQHAAARTYIKRDQSLVNRFEVIEFKDFDKEDYKYFLAPSLEEVKKDFLETFNLDLSYTDEFIDSLATASELKNKGVRGVNDYAVLLRGALIKFISDNPELQTSENENENENESEKEVTVSYDIKTNSFDVKLK